MKIILRRDVPNLGSLGDELEVKRGYAVNYLVPQGMAYAFRNKNDSFAQAVKTQLTKKQNEAVQVAQAFASQLESQIWQVEVEAGESGKIHGSVTSRDIRDLLAKENIEIERKLLNISPIKSLGSYTFPIKLHTKVTASLQVRVSMLGNTEEQTNTEEQEKSE